MEASFNDKRVLDALEQLQAHQQLAAGAACCERMVPNYATFIAEAAWGSLAPLRNALDAIWDACLRGASTEVDLKRSLAECEGSAPDADDFSSLYVSSAQDAAFSRVLSSISCVIGIRTGLSACSASRPTPLI